MRPAVSLVMATLGRVSEIDRCVDTLAAQTRRDFELIVVDQNPDDRLLPVVARARALGLDCHHLRQQEPNLCLARNTGIERAQGAVVAFPDDDCWYEHDVMEKVLARFEQAPALDGLVIRWVEAGNSPAGPLDFASCASFRGPVASSITLFFRRQTLRAAGSFDMALGLHSWYGAAEETDLILRLLHRGAQIHFDPEVHVHHAFMVASVAQAPARAFASTRRRARGTGALYARHPLSAWVIVRGLLSPWAHALRCALSPRRAAPHLGAGLGRLEGFVGWHLGHRPQRKERA